MVLGSARTSRGLLPLVQLRGPVLAGLLLLSAACGPAGGSIEGEGARASGDEGPMRVVATTGMIADAARVVGGDRVEVTGLMGPGVDPHLYRATEGDVADIAGSGLVLYNGLHLEAKMGEVFDRMGDRVPTAAVAEGIDPALLLAPPGFEDALDPHVWFDVSLWMTAVARVRDALAAADPSGASAYDANAERYLAELRSLDAYVRAQAERVPERQRVLITAHDAFHYFGRAYGFEVRGLQGISTATEAGAADVQSLAAFIADRRVPAIFVESSVPVRNVEAVQAAVRSRGFDVRIGGELYSDALGDEGTEAATYVGMVRHNVDTIVGALLADGSGQEGRDG